MIVNIVDKNIMGTSLSLKEMRKNSIAIAFEMINYVHNSDSSSGFNTVGKGRRKN
jgi:hypothetical protein